MDPESPIMMEVDASGDVVQVDAAWVREMQELVTKQKKDIQVLEKRVGRAEKRVKEHSVQIKELVRVQTGFRDFMSVASGDFVFKEVVAVETAGATAWKAFRAGGLHFVAVANSYNATTESFETASRIYEWDDVLETIKRPAVSEVTTYGAQDWEVFRVNGRTYLVVANHNDDQTTAVMSRVYRWDNIRKRIIEPAVAEIPTEGAMDWEAFRAGDNIYLAVANSQRDGEYKVKSAIYRWNTERETVDFPPVVEVETAGAHDWESFMINNVTFLAVANHFDGSSYEIDSAIYRWHRKREEVTRVATIPTQGAADWEVFGARRRAYLLVTNYRNDTTLGAEAQVFRWDRKRHTVRWPAKDNITTTAGAMDCEAFVTGGDVFFAMAYHYNGTRGVELDSPILRWNSTTEQALVRVQGTKNTTAARDWHYFGIDKKHYLGLANMGDIYPGNNTLSFINRVMGLP